MQDKRNPEVVCREKPCLVCFAIAAPHITKLCPFFACADMSIHRQSKRMLTQPDSIP
jgi:hypothetical protein